MRKLIELFLSKDREDQEEFNRQFKQIVSEVPNRVANFGLIFSLVQF